MDWKEFVYHTTNEAIEPVSNVLNNEGANGVVIVDPHVLTREKRAFYGELYALNEDMFPKEGVFIKAYFVANDQWETKKKSLVQKIRLLAQHEIDLGLDDVFVHDVKEEDWENEWKKYFKSLPITDTLTIVPSWEDYTKKNENEQIISIDPGMAFGTGTHPTTVLSMQAMEKTITPGDIILDVGSGSGVLSIGAVLLGAEHVYAYDLDEVAVHSTKMNRDINNFQHKITVKQNDILKNVSQTADIIVSNILADILLLLIDDAWDNLKDGGLFITSGIIQSKERIVCDAMEKKGFTILEKNEQNNWISFIAKKN